MGHTHLPDKQSFDNRHYLNPGSWTRYLDLEEHPHPSLDDLRDEARYPYELNYILVEADADGTPLVARLECFASLSATKSVLTCEHMATYSGPRN